MTQNLNLLLQNFFAKNPDVRKARNKGLVNRRALAKYIVEKEKLNVNKYEALVTALRRFEVEPATEEALKVVKDITVSTKSNIAIIYLEKNEAVLKNVLEFTKNINFNKNETLKFVQGSLSFKVFIDESKVKVLAELFSKKEILKIQHNIAELNLIFPPKAPEIKGTISYLTSELAISEINITEMLTGDPEFMFYVKEEDLLKTYETIKRLMG